MLRDYHQPTNLQDKIADEIDFRRWLRAAES